ncbi:MAG: methyltransferase domain-containing protein [Gemmatimonadaceae bacterium]
MTDKTPMYSRYYQDHPADRNDLLSNAEVTFQMFAADRANIRALQRLRLDRDVTRILDVGCATGAGIFQFLRLGFKPDRMTGVDISAERIAQARASLPNVEFRCESGASMSFGDGTFDLVFESTMFVLLPSEDLARAIASEMIRVTRPGGYLMLVDWRYGKPGSDVYKAMSPKRIAALFDVGGATRVVARERGALVPPLGRFLSRRVPSLYFAAQAMLPFAAGQITTVLQKT